ncbi:MAG: ATP-dependent DNA helicase RecG [Flavobacteriaceae bacterium TMED238]|nr:ATP-dependent DNA helicase RecG [Flavobacteriales bacterium]RPG60846.1 MAG: ATP-dependent DNA helicase RecG [Flavobacteriaceae bacterium TMED238]
MKDSKLNTSIEFIKGIGKIRAKIMKDELGIKTCYDLLNFYPYKYLDRSRFYKISELSETNIYVQIIGFFKNISYKKSGKKYRIEGVFYDGEKNIKVLWFRGLNWVEKSISINIKYVLYGKLNWFDKSPSFVHPDFENFQNFKKKSIKLQPVYSSTEKLSNSGISNKYFIKIIKSLFDFLGNQFDENLNEFLNQKYNLISPKQAYYNIHFPRDSTSLEKSKFRLKFEELFFNQLKFKLVHNKIKNTNNGYYFPNVGLNFNKFYNEVLEFDLTSAQMRVIKEIRNDFSSNKQMIRLLQGDVGSGKTIVALISILISIDNGFQACLVAPTEILAFQHFKNFKDSLQTLKLNVNILTGSSKISERKKILNELKNGSLDILIGTHALFEDNVVFKNLGFAVIDEQHRFGVKQRSKIWKKNNPPPHILIMTATPIPRTLTMSLYGDLDLSVIDELPAGRKDVITVNRKDKNRLKVFGFIKDQIKQGRQIYVVYPLIEESKKMDLKFLEDGYESILKEFDAQKYSVGVMHGRMKSQNKDFEMIQFSEGKTNILVSTTVIEVGVNVPNASVMIIENAERFGLSQLHQLRGRVGRGIYDSYCILMTNDKISDDAKVRIDAMVQTNDGFKISEVDLKLRGPGNILGTQQSGVLDFKIADLVEDEDILLDASNDALVLLKNDPKLILNENYNIRRFILNNPINKSWNEIG